MVLVAVVTFVAFLPALNNGFVEWDDQVVLLQNYNFRGLGWPQIRWMFSTGHMGHFQPMTWLTYGLDYTLWGMDPTGYHLTSMLFHAAAAAAFFWVVRALLFHAMGREDRDVLPGLTIAAGVGALFFAIHPLRVESVAWATERRDVTSGFFFLLTLGAYLHAVTIQSNPKMRKKWLAMGVSFYVVSLLSKSIGMTLPVVLVILDAYPLRRLGRFGRGWLAPEVRWVWKEKLLFLVPAVAAALLALVMQQQGGFVGTLDRVPWAARIAIACYAASLYLFNTWVPLWLSPLYAPDSPFDPWAWYFVLGGVVLLLVTVAAALTARRWPAGIVLWACYVIVLAPVVGLLQIGPQLAADRYTYLSCLGWAALGAAGWFALWKRRHRPGVMQALYLAGSALTVALLIALGVLTWRQTLVWRDTGSLWKQAIDVHPENGQAHSSLGAWYGRHGDWKKALEHQRLAVKYRPERVAGHARLGFVLSKLGRVDEAIAAFRKALELQADFVSAHTGLGVLLSRSLNRAEAREGLEHLQKAVALDPTHTASRFNLTTFYLQRGRYDRARQVLEDGVKADPKNPRFAARLAWLLATCPDPTVRDGEKALLLARRANQATADRDPYVLDVLAAALAENRDFEEAVRVAERAVRLSLRHPSKGRRAVIQNHLSSYRAGKPWRDVRRGGGRVLP